MTDSVDVIVLTWNDGDVLDVALRSALGSVGVETRVFVVDNGSEPAARCPASVELIRSESNLGVARGRNLGARYAQSEFLCFLDSDAELLPDTLVELLRALRSNDDIAMVVPVFVDQPPEASAGVRPSIGRKLARAFGLTSLYRAPKARSNEYWDVDFGIGACQFVRRSVFEELGGFDEQIFYGPEDLELCDRIRSQGRRVVQVRDARCIHPPRRRNRSILRRGGLRHARAVVGYYWRR